MASMLMLCVRLQLLQCMARHLANRLGNMIIFPIETCPNLTGILASKPVGLIIWIGNMD